MTSIIDKRLVLIITCLTAFTTPFLSTSVNIALPTINAEFAVPDQALLNWLVTSYLLVSAIFVVPFGRIADRYGLKKVFVTGLFVIVVSSALCAISGSIFMLIAFRAIEGIGAAMIFGTSMAILTSAYPQKERGKVLGIYMAVTYAGLSLGPSLGGFIIHFGSWRLIYAGIAVYALLVALLAVRKLADERSAAEKGQFDLPGTVLYGAVLVSLILGLSSLQEMLGIALFGLSLVLMAVFFGWELRQANPVLKVSVFRKNTVFMFSNLAALINYSAIGAVPFMLSLYLQKIYGLDALTTGLIMIVQTVLMVAFSPTAGKLSDRLEPRIVASAGMAICAIGLVLFAMISPETPLWLVVTSLIFMGIGVAFFSSPNTNAIMSSVAKSDFAVASSMVSTMRMIGGILGLGIANLIFTYFMGHTEIPATGPYDLLMKSIQVAFAVMAGLCIIGVGLSLARGNLRKAEVTPIAHAIKKS
ncbi:MFS transporter [Methanocella paludicola SANAE]|uniref:MFS transporter n=1 Tax=Methanocella paludicola (strain DSM 17711 / JCM 13418 / NBRC 101707 / SANAE) TaxID=304371 RepID=D1YYC7_METPS|nr:MFS transporter [Methanocella paludicola]BAI61449.1 MFS transporter [Methanocella paludicola SANAE]